MLKNQKVELIPETCTEYFLVPEIFKTQPTNHTTLFWPHALMVPDSSLFYRAILRRARLCYSILSVRVSVCLSVCL